MGNCPVCDKYWMCHFLVTLLLKNQGETLRNKRRKIQDIPANGIRSSGLPLLMLFWQISIEIICSLYVILTSFQCQVTRGKLVIISQNELVQKVLQVVAFRHLK